MKIRKATKKDFNKIAELINKEYSKSPYKEPWKKLDAIKTLEYFSKIGSIYVLTDKEIVGFIIFRIEFYNGSKGIMIEDLVVDSDFQGKGYGKKMVEYVEDFGRKQKVKGIWLLASKEAPAYHFYKKIGYKLKEKMRVFGKELK